MSDTGQLQVWTCLYTNLDDGFTTVSVWATAEAAEVSIREEDAEELKLYGEDRTIEKFEETDRDGNPTGDFTLTVTFTAPEGEGPWDPHASYAIERQVVQS